MHRTDGTPSSSTPAKPDLTNGVFRRLPEEERQRLFAAGAIVRLERRHVLQEAGTPMGVIVFPVSCVLSLQALTDEGGTVEVAMVGREGVVGFPTGHDAFESPYTIAVSIAGQALRFRRDVLRGAFDQSPAVRRVMVEQWHALLSEVARGSACHCFHTTLQRCAGWLLAASARVQSDTLALTHEDLAGILGLQRSAVTATAVALRHAGAIRYQQGRVWILDRQALATFACECRRAPSPERG